METVKMFDAIEIRRETNGDVDIFEIYRGNFCNDVAIPWWVEEEENEDYNKVNNYLLAHGATLGEKVWIDVTW